ncbi:hypothetical protein CPC08DRAFT_815115 [Agrocybe pediades]|nr:hypothetical protein CPC08DRAFT_815115 [Agrocybe pediades]
MPRISNMLLALTVILPVFAAPVAWQSRDLKEDIQLAKDAAEVAEHIANIGSTVVNTYEQWKNSQNPKRRSFEQMGDIYKARDPEEFQWFKSRGLTQTVTNWVNSHAGELTAAATVAKDVGEVAAAAFLREDDTN